MLSNSWHEQSVSLTLFVWGKCRWDHHRLNRVGFCNFTFNRKALEAYYLRMHGIIPLPVISKGERILWIKYACLPENRENMSQETITKESVRNFV